MHACESCKIPIRDDKNIVKISRYILLLGARMTVLKYFRKSRDNQLKIVCGKPQLHIHDFISHDRATIHPDLSSRDAST